MATSARNWKKPDSVELQLPSGNTCLVKRPGMEKLLAAGILPDSLTPIAMEAVKKAQNTRPEPEDHKKKKGQQENELDPELIQKFLEQDGALEDIFMAFDRVCAMVVVEPKVRLHVVLELDEDTAQPKKDARGRDVWKEIPLEERISADVDPTLPDGSPNPLYSEDPPLYTDEIDSGDKEHIFQFVSGGSAELTSFPDAGDDVATVQPVADVPKQTKRAPRTKK